MIRRGRIVLNKKNGFGLICDENEQEIEFNNCNFSNEFTKGLEVTFQILLTEGGLRAVKINPYHARPYLTNIPDGF